MTRTDVPVSPPRVAIDGLRITGVRKSYGPVPVLHGVDLAVTAGALTAVLGRSGCGKSTLLRIVAGFDRPDAGTVAIAGREVAGSGGVLPPEARRVGYVTQEGNLFPHLTVAANIVFGLPWRSRRAGHRVAELLELVGLDERYARRHPHELSGGEQQRVALARALAPEPGILLLDEPFSALDVELRESTRRAVAAALHAAGTTTLLVTHDQSEALSLATRVAVMRDGVIAQEASPAELYRHPVDRGVAAFVGDVVALPGVLHDGAVACALGSLRVAERSPGPAAGPVTVLVRPEQIVLDPVAGTPARVVEVEYFGHDAVVRLTLGTGEEVTARCPGYDLPDVGAAVRLVVRGEVGVA